MAKEKKYVTIYQTRVEGIGKVSKAYKGLVSDLVKEMKTLEASGAKVEKGFVTSGKIVDQFGNELVASLEKTDKSLKIVVSAQDKLAQSFRDGTLSIKEQEKAAESLLRQKMKALDKQGKAEAADRERKAKARKDAIDAADRQLQEGRNRQAAARNKVFEDQAKAQKKAAESLLKQKMQALSEQGRAEAADRERRSKARKSAFEAAERQLKESRIRQTKVRNKALADQAKAEREAAAKEDARRARIQKKWTARRRRMNRESRRAAQQQISDNKKVSLSWQSMVKIVQAQILSQAIMRITQSVGIATESFVELNLKVSEIQTIQADATNTTARWTRELLDLSNAFGVDVIDVAASAYQALSNQVVGASGAYDFLSEALIFSRTSASTAEDSVNLLSSALNAFGKGAIQTTHAAAVLFKTIELGRIKASDLANDFGVSASLSSQLSVSMGEMNAVLVTLTRQGVQASVAQTLFNNVMVKMLDPTEKMKELFRKWGVESGEAALQTFGFLGVMQKLGKEVDKGGAQFLGDIAGRIRAIRGFSGILSDVDRVGESLREMGVAGKSLKQIEKDTVKLFETYRANSKIVEQSLGVQFERAAVKVKNVLTEDLGGATAKFLIDFDNQVGGADQLLTSMSQTIQNLVAVATPFTLLLAATIKYLGPLASVVIPTAVVGLTAYTAANLAAASATVFLGASATGASAAIQVMTAAQATFNAVAASNPYVLGATAVLAAAALITSVFRSQAAKMKALAGDVARRQSEILKKENEERVEALKIQLAVAETYGALVVKAINTAFLKATAANSKLHGDLLKKTEQSKDSITSLTKAFANLIPDEAFKDSQALIDHVVTKLNEITNKIKEIQNRQIDRAESKLTASDLMLINYTRITDEEFPRYLSLLDKAKSKADQTYSKSLQDLETIRKELDDLNSNEDQKLFDLGLEGKSSGDQKKLLDSRIAAKRKEALAVNNLQDPKQLAKAKAAAEEVIRLEEKKLALAKQQREIFKGTGFTPKVSTTGIKSGVDLKRTILTRAESALDTESKTRKANVGILDKRREDAENFRIRSLSQESIVLQQQASIKIKRLKLLEREKELRQQIVQEIKKISELEIAALERQDTAIKKVQTKTTEQQGRAAVIAAKIRPSQLSSSITGSDAETARRINFVSSFRKFSKATSEDEVDQARKKLEDFLANPENLASAKATVKASGPDVEAELEKFLAGQDRMKVLKQELSDADALALEMQKQKNVLNSEEFKIQEKIKAIKDEQREKDLNHLDELRKKIAELKDTQTQAGLPSNTAGFSSGGMITGATGRDNQAFLAHRGEFVMNPSATAQFYPQLMAMNQGQTPKFSNGGATTNIGDMNFNISGQQSNPQQIAEDVAFYIRRGIQAGTIRRF